MSDEITDSYDEHKLESTKLPLITVERILNTNNIQVDDMEINISAKTEYCVTPVLYLHIGSILK